MSIRLQALLFWRMVVVVAGHTTAHISVAMAKLHIIEISEFVVTVVIVRNPHASITATVAVYNCGCDYFRICSVTVNSDELKLTLAISS